MFQYFSWGLRRNYFILSAFLRSSFAFFFLPCSTVDWLAFNVRCACSTGFPLNVEESENYQKSEKSETSNGGEVPMFLWYTFTGFKIVDLMCISGSIHPSILCTLSEKHLTVKWWRHKWYNDHGPPGPVLLVFVNDGLRVRQESKNIYIKFTNPAIVNCLLKYFLWCNYLYELGTTDTWIGK